MDDLGNYKVIFYLLMALLYFLFSGRKKKPAVPPQQQAPKAPSPSRSQPASATASSKPKKLITVREKQPVPRPPAAPVSLEDLMKDYGNLEKEAIPERRENKKPASLEVQDPKVIDYDDAYLSDKGRKHSFIDEEVLKDKAFNAYAQEQAGANPYAAMLKNPETIKTVIVAQEIFTPKYF